MQERSSANGTLDGAYYSMFAQQLAVAGEILVRRCTATVGTLSL